MIRYPGWKRSVPEIRDEHPGSATLFKTLSNEKICIAVTRKLCNKKPYLEKVRLGAKKM
jgi:hypothetical protein